MLEYITLADNAYLKLACKDWEPESVPHDEITKRIYDSVDGIIETDFPLLAPHGCEDIVREILREESPRRDLANRYDVTEVTIGRRFREGKQVLRDRLYEQLHPDSETSTLPPNERSEMRITLLSRYPRSLGYLGIPITEDELMQAEELLLSTIPSGPLFPMPLDGFSIVSGDAI